MVHPAEMRAWLKRHRHTLDAMDYMGAISSTSATDGELVLETNFGLSWYLWKWCAHHGKRFIYASSAATYGDGSQGYDDGSSPDALSMLRPLNLYRWSKHRFDRRVARATADGERIPPQWAGPTFFNVYGPNEYHKGTMHSVVAHRSPWPLQGRR